MEHELTKGARTFLAGSGTLQLLESTYYSLLTQAAVLKRFNKTGTEMSAFISCGITLPFITTTIYTYDSDMMSKVWMYVNAIF